MWAVMLLAFTAGATFGFAQLRASALIPITFVFALITVVVSASLALDAGTIALVVFCTTLLLQVSYLIGSVLSDVPVAYRVRVQDRVLAERELFGIVRTAIAEELRAHFEPPLGDLPPQVYTKLALLEAT
jgi:hypothetical protein